MITVIAFVGFLFFYAAYKYLLIWTADQPGEMETGGLYYIKALRTVFVALYLEQICLAGLFFLSANAKDDQGYPLPDKLHKQTFGMGIGCGVIIVLVGAFTAVTQAYIDHVQFKKVTIMYGRMSKDLIISNSSHAELNAAEKTLSTDEAKSPVEQLANEHEFDHPALWKPQPIIWVADDPLGIGRSEVERLSLAGVDASTAAAHMNEKGDLAVDRSPPDEPWEERPHDDDVY
jgi:hypothetical protein